MEASFRRNKARSASIVGSSKLKNVHGRTKAQSETSKMGNGVESIPF